MMGICNSCFGSSSKYLSRSPENTFLDSDDAQKLLPKPIVKKPSVCAGSGKDEVKIVVQAEKASPTAASDSKSVTSDLKNAEEKVPLCRNDDSGTCVNEDSCSLESEKIINSTTYPTATTENDERVECLAEERPPNAAAAVSLDIDRFAGCDPFDLDPVQLTVSSLGSVGGVLQDVPEHCELGADENEENFEDLAASSTIGSLAQEASKLPPKAPVMHTTSNESTVTSGIVKNTPKVRHHSIGSRTILAANPNEGKTIYLFEHLQKKLNAFKLEKFLNFVLYSDNG